MGFAWEGVQEERETGRLASEFVKCLRICSPLVNFSNS